MTQPQTPQSSLSHLDQQGQAQMVDVSAKPSTVREATAQAAIKMAATTLAQIEAGNTPKGDVLGTARIAGIMAAKQTSNLIPLCHPLPIQKVEVLINPARPARLLHSSHGKNQGRDRRGNGGPDGGFGCRPDPL